MNYEEWLIEIEDLKKTNTDLSKLEKLKKIDINNNIQELLEPKLINLVKEKFKISINEIIKELPIIFSDTNYLDLNLINFKKQLNFILEIINLKQISFQKQKELKEMLIKETNNVYEILINEANRNDQTGIYTMIINNNKIKWSE